MDHTCSHATQRNHVFGTKFSPSPQLPVLVGWAAGAFLFHANPVIAATDNPVLDDISVVQKSIRKLQNEELETKALFSQIEYLLDGFQISGRLQYAITVSPPEGRLCAIGSAAKTVDDLRIISEYYSVANDGAQKLMIADSYPGEKLEFVRQGLRAVDQDFNEFFRCYSKIYF